MKKTWVIFPGHSDLIGGVYPTAPDKMYKHKNFTIYEGEYNRRVVKLLESLLHGSDVRYINIVDTPLDLPLSLRVRWANDLHLEYGNCVGLEIHGNAGKGTGFEVWTSPGITPADPISAILFEKLEKQFPDEVMRSDWTDGYPDKESKFYTLVNTIFPHVLSENGFMDRLKDARKMMTHAFQWKVAKAHYECIMEVEKSKTI